MKLGYEQVFHHLHGLEREFTLSLLCKLFPKLRKFHQVRGLSSYGILDELEADKEKRIYHPDYFMTYFSLHIEEGYFGTQELEELSRPRIKSRMLSKRRAILGITCEA